jgi:murein DD-endopeptidase MepM/ murein hydrolase activator NlpD
VSKNKYDVYAPLAGTIKYALKSKSDYGYRIYLETQEGTFMFAHLESFAVKEGDVIEAGDTLGVMGSTGYGLEGARHLHMSYFLPTAKKLTAAYATDPTFVLQLAECYPTNTKVSNGYGSKYCNPKLEKHEGIDFSAVHTIEGWKNKRIDPLFQDYRVKEKYPEEYT